MPVRENDPLRNFRFRVEVDGITQAGFSEVSGIDTSLDVVEYRVGNDPTHLRKLSGLTKFSNITLKWGITTSMDLFTWIDSAVTGDIQRKAVTIISIDEEGNDKATWVVSEAWPAKYTGPSFDAKGNAVGLETLELAHEGIKRTA
jgi:phage tail-like protein